MFDDLLRYELGAGVEAFSTLRNAALPYPAIQGHQVHGIRVAIVDRPDMTRPELEGYDAFITHLPGVAIGVRTADCVPVLLYDPVMRVVAAVHAGWKGTVRHISQEAIIAMTQVFKCRPANLKAVMGPAIGPSGVREAVGNVGRGDLSLFLWDFVGLRGFPVASATEPLSRGEGFGERVTWAGGFVPLPLGFRRPSASDIPPACGGRCRSQQ